MITTERDLFKDLKNSGWMIKKIQTDNTYAQNLYAALCDVHWQPQEVVSILKDEFWSYSWRMAGQIVAELQNNNGNYLDWYCSGIGDETPDTGRWINRPKTYVKEGTVTEQIRQDMLELGWHPCDRPTSK